MFKVWLIIFKVANLEINAIYYSPHLNILRDIEMS